MQSDLLNKYKNLKPSKSRGGEWSDLVGELTDFINADRGSYKPVSIARIAKSISYMKFKNDLSDVRFFVAQVKKKGVKYYWWVVKPKV